MSATTEPAQNLLDHTRESVHPNCIVCNPSSKDGLALRFVLCDDGSVETTFPCTARHQGYEGILHGGVTSSLLDGAMTNCLFAHGMVALTAEITVRFRHPIEVDQSLQLRAHITRSQPPLHIVQAEILQNEKVMARAEGKFIENR